MFLKNITIQIHPFFTTHEQSVSPYVHYLHIQDNYERCNKNTAYNEPLMTDTCIML